MNIRFDGKVVLVTAGASGIGEAIVEAFGDAGATVIISDINDEAGMALADRLKERGVPAEYVHSDMTSEAQAQALVEHVVAAHGRLDILVNGVGNIGGGDRPGLMLHEMSAQQWLGTMDVSLTSTFLGMKYALVPMKAQGGGAIVNIASQAGLHVQLEASPAYGSAKAGVIHLTRIAATAYGPSGIRVNAVAPGLTLTPTVARVLSPELQKQMVAHYPLRRPTLPSEQADAVLYLASDRASMVTGHVISVDGGQNAL